MRDYKTLEDLIKAARADIAKEEREAKVSAHYEAMEIEPWDVIGTWPIEQQIGYHRGNILKYTMRMGSKDDRLKEAKKVADYAKKLVQMLERKQ